VQVPTTRANTHSQAHTLTQIRVTGIRVSSSPYTNVYPPIIGRCIYVFRMNTLFMAFPWSNAPSRPSLHPNTLLNGNSKIASLGDFLIFLSPKKALWSLDLTITCTAMKNCVWKNTLALTASNSIAIIAESRPFNSRCGNTNQKLNRAYRESARGMSFSLSPSLSLSLSLSVLLERCFLVERKGGGKAAVVWFI